MNYATANNTIATRFKTTIKDVESIAVQYDNQIDFTPPKSLWCRLSIKFGEGFQASLGAPDDRLYRNQGMMFVQIYDVIGNGTGSMMGLVDKINVAFRGISVGELLFRTPNVSVSRREGDYWQINVDCPFVFESIN